MDEGGSQSCSGKGEPDIPLQNPNNIPLQNPNNIPLQNLYNIPLQNPRLDSASTLQANGRYPLQYGMGEEAAELRLDLGRLGRVMCCVAGQQVLVEVVHISKFNLI